MSDSHHPGVATPSGAAAPEAATTYRFSFGHHTQGTAWTDVRHITWRDVTDLLTNRTMLGQSLLQRGTVGPSTAPGGSTSRRNALIGTAPPATPAELQQLDQPALAHRWRVSPRTLEGWRLRKQGPPYFKVGSKVLYRLKDVEAFEAARLRQGGA